MWKAGADTGFPKMGGGGVSGFLLTTKTRHIHARYFPLYEDYVTGPYLIIYVFSVNISSIVYYSIIYSYTYTEDHLL